MLLVSCSTWACPGLVSGGRKRFERSRSWAYHESCRASRLGGRALSGGKNAVLDVEALEGPEALQVRQAPLCAAHCESAPAQAQAVELGEAEHRVPWDVAAVL